MLYKLYLNLKNNHYGNTGLRHKASINNNSYNGCRLVPTVDKEIHIRVLFKPHNSPTK